MCPDLPELVADLDGGASPDSVITLAPRDRETVEACRAVVRECMACIQRGRDAGAIR